MREVEQMSTSEISWCGHGVVSRSTQDAITWVASQSLRNQEGFLVELAGAQTESGVHQDVVAERLGITIEQLEEALSSPGDLSLDELRLFSIAAEVLVSYRVRAAHREYSDHHRALRNLTHQVRTELSERAARRSSDHAHWTEARIEQTWRWAAEKL